MKNRILTKDEYYLTIAESVSRRSTCLRRLYGAVIVRDDEIISTGYNGAPRGAYNCCDNGSCARMNIPHGERYELCRAVHAEANAIISAPRDQMIGATLYLVGFDYDTGAYIKNTMPCSMCKRLIINSGIIKVVVRDTDTECLCRYISPTEWIGE
jgi:dCMP deaminase